MNIDRLIFIFIMKGMLEYSKIKEVLDEKNKKNDPKVVQSVLSFACPCLETCHPCISCACIGLPEATQVSYNGSKVAVALLTRYGTQTVNYN